MVTDREEKVVRIYSELDCRRILDIGCGSGGLSHAIKSASDAEEVYGVDVSEQVLEHARRQGVTATRLDIDEENLPFDDGFFDSIHSGEVVDYLSDPDHFFREIHRCLASDGVFVLSTTNLSSIHNRLALLVGRLPYPLRASADTLVSSDDGRAYPMSERCTLFTYETLRETLRAHGFEILQSKGAHSYLSTSSTAVELVEDTISTFPSLSYRFIFVCKKRDRTAGKANVPRTSADASVEGD